MFLFQCYTGQRFNDIRNLSPSELQRTVKDTEWHLYQRKGNKESKVIIPIMDQAKIILDKYLDPANESKNPIFPKISNQKTNKHIKKVCALAGITEEVQIVRYSGNERIVRNAPKCEFISSHTARRTFVTLSIKGGMNPQTIMRITGHESYNTMKLYMDIDNDFAKKEYKRVWSKGGRKEEKELSSNTN